MIIEIKEILNGFIVSRVYENLQMRDEFYCEDRAKVLLLVASYNQEHPSDQDVIKDLNDAAEMLRKASEED